MLGWQSDKEKEGICMKKILMFLSAILLIFAVSCSSDNPQPSESGGTAGNNPNAPEVNTGTSQEELMMYASIGMGIAPETDPDVEAYMESLSDDASAVFFTKEGLMLEGADDSMTFTLDGYETEVMAGTSEDSPETVDCTVWGTRKMSTASVVCDYIVRIDSENKVFSAYLDFPPSMESINIMKINGVDVMPY